MITSNNGQAGSPMIQYTTNFNDFDMGMLKIPQVSSGRYLYYHYKQQPYILVYKDPGVNVPTCYFLRHLHFWQFLLTQTMQ